MIIIVSLNNFVNDLMTDIADRLSIVQPYINYQEHLIEVKLETMENIQIIFKPALLEYIKGTRPDYYWTNSYDADKYFREAHSECLHNFVQLTDLVLRTCMLDENV